MFRFKKSNNNGVALLVVLAVILIVVALSNAILSIMLSHASLTKHNIGRIQAIYAAQAVANYAIQELDSGNWTAATCATPCNFLFDAYDFSPNLINNATIEMWANAGPENTIKIQAKINYSN